MPFVRIDHPAGKSSAYRKALSKGIYAALRATFNVPENDNFQVIDERTGVDIIHPSHYLGIDYSKDFVAIQITCNEGRSLEQKKALYAAIADHLVVNPGLRREDILINLVEVRNENWSFGNGIAQYAL